jgi:hypothetical protein
MDDEDCALEALGYRRQVLGHSAGALWRVTAADGTTTTGASSSARSARREAAFAAFTLSAIARIRARR